MSKREFRLSHIVSAIVFCFFFNFIFGMEIKTVFSYDEIYALQKSIPDLSEAEKQFLYTLVEAPELLGNEEQIDFLGNRIYGKKRLIENFSDEDMILKVIIEENTDSLLEYLDTASEKIEGYEDKYEFLDFVKKDFDKSMELYSLQKLKKHLNIIYMNDFHKFFELTENDYEYLAENLVNNFINNRMDFNNTVINKLAKFGGERLLQELNVRITPHILLNTEDNLRKEYNLLSILNDLHFALSQNLGKAVTLLPQLSEKYEKLKNYFSLKEEIEILDRRVLTIEKASLNGLIPLISDYINQYEKTPLEKEKIKTALISLVNNMVSRYSYEKSIDISPENKELIKKTSSIVNDIETSLRHFEKMIVSETPLTEEPVNEPMSEENEINVISIIIPVLIILLSVLLVFLFLPKKKKAFLLKKIGRKEKAYAMFQKLSFEKPRDPDIHVAMAQLLEEMNREEEAINEYRIASKLVDIEEKGRT